MNSNHDTAREILRYTLSRLSEEGYPPHSVCSEPGEPSAIVSSVDTALDALFEGDDTIIYFGRQGRDPDPCAWIFVIPENGNDVLSDWTFSENKFSSTLEGIIDEMEHLKCEGCGLHFKEQNAVRKAELVDHAPGWARVYHHSEACPRCGSDKLEDVLSPPPF